MSQSSSSDSTTSARIEASGKAVLDFWHIYSSFGISVCTDHRCSYTAHNYLEHLKRAHNVTGHLRQRVEAWIRAQNIADRVVQPPPYDAPFFGLEIWPGWKCDADDCTFLTQSDQVFFRHASQSHQLSSKRQQQEKGIRRRVHMQAFFAKSKDYFIVDPTLGYRPHPQLPATSDTQTISHIVRRRVDQHGDRASARTHLTERFRASQETAKGKYSVVGEPRHTSELTPWLRLCKYHEHFTKEDLDDLAASYGIPGPKDANDQLLFQVARSANRVFQHASHLVSRLHHVDARRVNTFQPGTLSQDPIEKLQELHSASYYANTLTKLICYFCRVTEGHFDHALFETTTEQDDALSTLRTAVETHLEDLASHPAPRLPDDHDAEGVCVQLEEDRRDHEAWVERCEIEADRCTQRLCIALVEHTCPPDGAWTPMLSFCAALAWNPADKTWRTEDQCGSHLSQLIYCSQLMILLHARQLVEFEAGRLLSPTLHKLCDTWLVNDTKGPVSDMNRLRLYVMKISRNTVNPAQIRWHRDGETLNYADITYSLSFLREEIAFCLKQARIIFERDLCLNLSDIPIYDIADLRDNWDSRRPGLSFVDDPRNAAILEGGQDWLWQAILSHAELRSMVLHLRDSDQTWQVRSEFAQQYELSVQRFLEYMMVLIHKGSGQPARRKEFLGMRWQNVGLVKRDLFLHDGHVLYLLTYHKSLSRTHASRHPVRVLLPEVGLLLVQFLVLIQPPRRHFCQEVQIPVEVSEYLWAGWPEDKMTRIVSSMSKQAVGERVNIQSWRQIAVGIAIKKFSGLAYEADLDLPGDVDDDLGGKSIVDSFGGAMADVFHLQAAHSVHTGNRAYGGTVNFNAGLTDAGLQEYFRASRMWHQLCRPQQASLIQATGHRRRASSSLNVPLAKRLALRQQPRRHRRRWSTDTVHRTLQRLFPHQPEVVRFKSESQAQLLNSIVLGHAEIVGVLGTGAGKSLSFMLPACLPNAATTVVVVPLVALKSDVVRRCREANVAHSVWSRHTPPQEYIGCQLLFVAVEEAVSRRFRTFLGQLDASDGLDRVVFDESHLILTASRYRPKMALVKELREYRCQVVFLTATLPPLMQAQFEQRMLLFQPCVVRSLTFRRDLFYHLQRSSRPGDFLEYMERGVQATLVAIAPEEDARAIVYTQTRGEADKLSQRLTCPVYYSDSGSTEEKEEVLQRWRQGTSKVVVATSAFGMGVDYPCVRAVIHMGPPRDMISFAQEVGRLGRDGRGGTSRIVLPYNWQASTSSSFPNEDDLMLPGLAMRLYLGQCRCLVAVLSRFQDGGQHVKYCAGSDRDRWCSLCQQFGIFSEEEETDYTSYWDGPVTTTPHRDHDRDMIEDDPDSDDSTKFVAGQSRLRMHRRDEEKGRDRFRQRLDALRGRCMICAMLGGKSGESEWHELETCRHGSKWDFFRAKKGAVERGRQRCGWMSPYVACYGCANPQEICNAQGPATCEYRDMILPMAWALFHMRNRWGQSLEDISGASQVLCSGEDRWMDWLGEECGLYGWRACQAARLADWVMANMLQAI